MHIQETELFEVEEMTLPKLLSCWQNGGQNKGAGSLFGGTRRGGREFEEARCTREVRAGTLIKEEVFLFLGSSFSFSHVLLMLVNRGRPYTTRPARRSKEAEE